MLRQSNRLGKLQVQAATQKWGMMHEKLRYKGVTQPEMHNALMLVAKKLPGTKYSYGDLKLNRRQNAFVVNRKLTGRHQAFTVQS